MKRINVTKTFLPPVEEYEAYVRRIWQSGQLTNGGQLVQKLESELRQYMGVTNLRFVANGTLALQLSLRALDITEGEVITTPFSYVATISSILWERCTPVFVDIEPETFCMDANKIEAAITDKTRAILPVHVFGYPCDVERIESIAREHDIKVIYDGAHAFGVEYEGKSLLSRGDISICSFHSTKLFHTIEGGCIIAKDRSVINKVELLKRFGHTGDEHFILGINAKSSEFQAAMGLCNLKYIDDIIAKRKHVSKLYDSMLKETVRKPRLPKKIKYNYAYYPIVLKNERHLHKVMKTLEQEAIFPRRYFYPSLNTLPYIQDAQSCPVSEDIANRIMCLPLYSDLEEDIVAKVCKAINT